MAEAKEIRLSLEPGPADKAPEPVSADSEALSLIMSNLVTNAIKYTPQGGSVRVSITSAGRAGARERLCVEDTGIGISLPDQQRILSGFYRTEAGRQAAKGFGVGLMLVKLLLEKHGSSLEIDSAPGRGSRFSFELPLSHNGAGA